MSSHVEREVPLDLIELPARPHRISIDDSELNRLADDIAANGLHQVVGVRELADSDRLVLIYGHRRLLAHRMLRRASIRARVYPHDADELQIRMAENELRADLTPVEQAHICREFVERGDPVAAVARYFRRSDQWVRGRLALLDLPDELQAAVADRVITVGVAWELARVDYEPYRRDLIREAANHGCTERTAQAWASQYLADAERIKANTMKVEEIAARREQFRMMTDCAVCRASVDFADTRALRVCSGCMQQLLAALAEEAGQAG